MNSRRIDKAGERDDTSDKEWVFRQKDRCFRITKIPPTERAFPSHVFMKHGRGAGLSSFTLPFPMRARHRLAERGAGEQGRGKRVTWQKDRSDSVDEFGDGRSCTNMRIVCGKKNSMSRDGSRRGSGSTTRFMTEGSNATTTPSTWTYRREPSHSRFLI